MKTFEELGVSPEIRRAIEEMGYENPMPVQEEVIPYLLGENNEKLAGTCCDLQDVQLQRAVCRAASEPYHVPDRRSL